MPAGFKAGKQRRAQKTGGLPPFLAPYAPLMGGLDYENADIIDGRRGYATALKTVSAIYRAVQLRADAVNRVKFSIKTRDAEGNPVTLAESDNRQGAHPFLSAFRMHRQAYHQPLLKAMVYSIDLYGETFLEKQRNDYEFPAGLRWLNPLGMTVMKGAMGITGYHWSMPNEGWTDYDPDEIAYKIEFNPVDDLRGQSKVQTVIDTINVDRNLRRFLRDFFRNNARPATIISPDAVSGGMMSTFTREHMDMIRDQVNAFLKGAGNQFSTLTIPIPANVTTLDQPDLKGFYDVHDPLMKETFGAFGVPLSMAGYTTDVATYKDGDEILRAFYLNTIYPLVLDIEDYFNDQVIPFFDPTLSIWMEFDTSGFDRVTQADLNSSQLVFGKLTNGLITIGQANQELDSSAKYDAMLDDMYMVQGVPVPKSELASYWKYRMLVAPSVFNSQEITGEPLPQPVDPTQVVPSGNPEAPVGEPLDQNAPEVSAEFDPTTGKMVYVPVIPAGRKLPVTMKATETDVPQPYCVLVDLVTNPQVWTVQDMLALPPDALIVPEAEFHITLVNLDSALLADIEKSLPINAAAFSVVVDGIDQFDTPDGFAVYLRVRNGEIFPMQSALVQALEANGIQVNEFARAFKPHITLAYSRTPIEPRDITPFAIVVNGLVVSDDTRYEVYRAGFKSSPAKTDARMKEYRAWREVKMKHPARKFNHEVLPPELTNAVNADLESAGDDKAQRAAVFDTVKLVLQDGDTGTPLDVRYTAYKSAKIDADLLAEVMSRFEEIGLTDLLDTIPDTEGLTGENG